MQVRSLLGIQFRPVLLVVRKIGFRPINESSILSRATIYFNHDIQQLRYDVTKQNSYIMKNLINKSGTIHLTGNSREYHILYRIKLDREQNVCHICAPHQGCNLGVGRKRKATKSWKWKTKNKRQWMHKNTL